MNNSDTATNNSKAAGLYCKSNGVLKRTFILQNHLGLHCRAATCLAETLSRYHCSVLVTNDDAVTEGTSVLGLLSLAAGYGAELTFKATGTDSQHALDAVQKLFESNFESAYADRVRNLNKPSECN